MLELGVVRLKEQNVQYNIVDMSCSSGFSRLDVFEDDIEYSIIDTGNCVAAYYKKQQEKFYGDVDLIKRIFRTKNLVMSVDVKAEQKVEIIDGKPTITITKKDERAGIYSKVVMVSGEYKYKEYETEDTHIIINDIDNRHDLEIRVINLNEYMSYSLSKDKMVGNSSADYYSEEYLRAKYNLDHLDKFDLVVVDSMVTAVARLKQWAEAPTKVKAIDLETTGLEWCMFGKDVITGIVLSWGEMDGTYFPFRQEKFKYNLPISFIQTILDTVNSQPKDVKIIGHNAKVEIQGIWKEDKHYVGYSDYAREWDKDCEINGLDNPQLRIDGDSMLLSILVNPTFERNTHSLKGLAYRIRGLTFLELDDIFIDKKNIKFNVLPPNIVKLYACTDTANTIAVWNYLLPKLPTIELSILDLESKLIYVTAENEFYGMRTRRAKLVDAIANENYKINVLGDMFRKIHKTSKNINSNQVRADIFYKKLRCPIRVRTKTGQPSTSNIALKEIVESGRLSEYDKTKIPKDIKDMFGKTIIKGEELISNKYPSLVILQHYAKAVKEYGALRRIERKSVRDRVMFGINQAGAATGRRTSDAHQYSDAMKDIIMADSDEHRFWSADFKQIELRILAYLAGQEDLIELESDPDVDVHRAILSIITGKPIWAISAKERKKGKSTNFGVVYMMSAYGLAKKNTEGHKCTDEDVVAAMESINGFYNGLPKIKAFVKHNEEFIREKGYIRTKFGRFRYFKEVLDPNTSEKVIASKIRAGNNTPVQGFGADWLKIVECNMRDYIREKGWDEKVDCNGVWLPKVRMMLSIHDEVLVSTHKSIPIEEIITMFKTCMEMKVKGAPPFFSAPAMVNTWLDGKNDQFEIDIRFRDEIVEAWEHGHKRLLHADTYDDSLDYKQVAEIESYCRKARKDFLSDIDFPDGKFKPKQETIDKVKQRVQETNMLNMLTKHFISQDEKFREDEIADIVAKRVLDESYSHYLEDLTRFRSGRLKKYMDGLIAEYKTVDAVAEHVRHPELTHTLIAVEIKKDEKFDHMEAIHEATRRYMEKRDTTEILDVNEVEYEEDRGSMTEFEELEEYIEFDQDGNVIMEDDETIDGDKDDLTVLHERDYALQSVERERAVYMLNDVIVDMSDYKPTDEEAERINQNIAAISSKDKPYNVVYYINNKLVRSQLYIDYVPKLINNLFEEAS